MEKEMKTVKLIIDGKEISAQINEEDLKALENEKNFHRQSKNKPYFFFDGFFNLQSEFEEFVSFNENRYKTGNYFITDKECEDAARVVSLWLQMKRFADEHNEESIDFDNRRKTKLSICFDEGMGQITLGYFVYVKNAFQIYFDSEEIARKAINEFHDELIWYFTEYGKDNKITTSKEIQYKVNVGSGCANGTIFVDEVATDEEIKLAIMDDLYDVDYHEVVKEDI